MCLTIYLGHRYGYRRDITVAGVFWRALLVGLILSWSIVGGRSLDVGWGLFLPAVLAWPLSGPQMLAVPAPWIALSAQLAAYLVAVAYGHSRRKRSYVAFPSKPAVHAQRDR